MTPSNVTNGSAASCATITARWLERFVAAGKGGVHTRFGGVGAGRARRNYGVFYAAEIAAARMLFFSEIGDDGYFDLTRLH